MTTSMHTTEKDIQQEMLDVLQDLGWTFISRTEMNTLRGSARMNEAIVEPLLVDAIVKLNPGLDEDTAREVAALVRRINSDREMLDVLRNGVPYKPAPDQPTVDVKVLDTDNPNQNSYVVTEELALRTGGQREPRLDVVCLVNGLPLGAIENKDTSKQLSDAADDWRGYWADVPQLVAQVSLVGCCNGIGFRVGPSGTNELSGYHRWSDAWPGEAADPDDEMLVALTGAFAPHALTDLSANFVVFETREGVTTKKLARAHQFRAANKLVARVLAGQLDRGLIWHATGSGKSLTMVFAARKLQRVGLGDPTVLLIIDRTELDEQINETLTACEFPGVRHPGSRAALAAVLDAGGGGVVVVTMHKFDETMAGKLAGSEVIAFVDEAHRTQFGDFGTFMRAALPNAKLFGFTGTPIELDSKHSTRKVFSPVQGHGTYEPYLDRFGFDQAIADGATVPVVFEPRLPAWSLSRQDLDARFDELTDGLTRDEKDALREQATKEKVIAKAPERVQAVAADVAEQLRQRVAPNGLAGMYVGCDREACALMSEQLAGHLEPDEYAVVMSRSKKDSAPRQGQPDLRFWYPSAQWERVHGHVPQPDPDASEEDDIEEVVEDADEFYAPSDRAAIKDYVRRIKDASDPLRLLIVNSMLLTGFDAPPVQALFLDRGLRGHTLMQAVSRTNRRYPDKDAGLVLDYWDVFDDFKSALGEFADADLVGLVENSDALIKRLPDILKEGVAIVAGAPSGSARRRMLWVVRHLTDHPDERQRFEDLVREAQSVYETLSPDPRLLPYMDDYADLLEIWLAWVRGTRQDKRTSDELRHKTRLLVQESIGMDKLRDDLPAATIDAEFLAKLIADEELTPEEKATDIEAALVHETVVRGEDDPRARALSERLAALRRKRDKQAQTTLDGLKEWLQLGHDHVEQEQEAQNLGLGEAGAVVHAVLVRAAPTADNGQVAAVAAAVEDAFKSTAGFDGWSERRDVIQGLRRATVAALVAYADTRRLARDPQVADDILAGLATIDRQAT